MWFEGRVIPGDIPKLIEKLLTSPDAKGTPMWTMVSSNIGTAETDDGYVFHSTGESGTDNIWIGCNPTYLSGSDSYWYEGHYFFVLENYIPGSPGQNGERIRRARRRPRYHYDVNFNGMSKDSLLEYYISVTRDRVVMMFSNGIASNTIQAVRSVLYLGMIHRYSDEKTSGAVAIAGSYDGEANVANYVYILQNGSLRGESYRLANESLVRATYATRADGKFSVFNMPLKGTHEGVRGELDGVLVAPFYSSTSYQNAAPEDGPVIIDGKEYIAARKKYYSQSRHDQLAPIQDGTIDFIYYIEKK